MIQVFEGRIGSGKSYNAVLQLAEHLACGLTACTNIHINWDGMKALCLSKWGVEIQDGQFISLVGVELAEFHKITPKGSPGAPVLVVLDEAQMEWNARDWNKTSREMLLFLTLSRHQDTDIVFISQSALNIDKQFMRLVQYIWRFRDLRSMKIPGLGLGWSQVLQVLSFGIHSGEMILAVKFDYDGRTVYDREFLTLDKRVFGAYESKCMKDHFQRAGQRGRVALRRKRLSEGGVILRVLMGIVAVLLIGWAIWVKIGGAAKDAPRAAVAGAAPVAGPSPAGVVDGQASVLTGRAVTPIAPLVERSGFSQTRNARFNNPAPELRQYEEAAQAAYDIYCEQFVGWQSKTGTLKTVGGTYQRGHMSGKGYVVNVEDREAAAMQPNGRLAWIVAQEGFGPVAGAPVPLAPAPVVVPPVPAALPPAVEVKNESPRLAELESARARAEINRPIGARRMMEQQRQHNNSGIVPQDNGESAAKNGPSI